MEKHIKADWLIFSPGDVDLEYSSLRNGVTEKTYVLGAFNPGLCRLPNGNLLMMVRVAEALLQPVVGEMVHCIRWEEGNTFTTDEWPIGSVDMTDPRKFRLKDYDFPVYGLTSLSWLLPVELNEDGTMIRQIHYDKIIAPASASQQYGIEDPRISVVDGRYYMTACCVSSESHATMLYVSDNGLDYRSLGIVLGHQNKDMLLFEGKIGHKYYTLTRPMGECYFAAPPSSSWHPGAAIHLASSPDLLHWKPADTAFLRAGKASSSNEKIGGGTPPIHTPDGWLMIYHGVQSTEGVGIYRSFWALLDSDDPLQVICLEDSVPVLESNPELIAPIKHQAYLDNIVFTTGISEYGDDYLLASGESDLACRMTRISKKYFSKKFHT
jgi:predicted GH43/DUF377 family glycosyl hydrolase